LGETEKKGALGIGTIAADGYTALIEALETVGHTEILSSPRIMATNNQEAKILVGSTEPYVTTTTTTPSAGPTTTAESVSFIDVGVKLFVTPTIHKDGFVTMKIKPEVSSVVRNVTTGNNNTIPVVETSEAETTVMAKDHVTIVLGGLIKEEKIKTVKKVPLLGSIPVLGMAFQSKSDFVRKTEIVLFLTPKIISGDVEAGGYEVSSQL
jgi:general secretion pathway protein D